MPAFGTSGLRGLVSELTDALVYGHSWAFLRYLEQQGGFTPGDGVILGGDLRPSTPDILRAAWQGVLDAGGKPVFAGFLPSPALALAGFQARVPSLMITGSHIPFDRNGIKFNRPDGELSKADESGILGWLPQARVEPFHADGRLRQPPVLPMPAPEFLRAYGDRYRHFFAPGTLAGWRVGVYQHSGVARDLLPELLRDLGADVVTLGRSEQFVPMDTEALRPEDRVLAREAVAANGLHALLSTDGDADRPMLADETGAWWRGDVLGIVTARLLEADAVVTPISSNTALERCGQFARIARTRIGSPYVIAGMDALRAEGAQRVVGYEANGGFLLGTAIPGAEGADLAPLPTRDAILPMLAALAAAARAGQALSSLREDLPPRFTASDRVQNFPTALSQTRLQRYQQAMTGSAAFVADFGAVCPAVAAMDFTDGVRVTGENGEIIHLRPSGNAPELRCYTEADTAERAEALLSSCMELLRSWCPAV